MAAGEGGDCFASAMMWAVALNTLNNRAIHVCHGQPIGTGPLNNGKRFWHAWVEFLRPGHGWTVIDGARSPENRKPAIMVLRDEYYRAGQIVAADVQRYGIKTAAALMAKTGHTGPWVDEERLKEAL